jgi:hypothetical protein
MTWCEFELLRRVSFVYYSKGKSSSESSTYYNPHPGFPDHKQSNDFGGYSKGKSAKRSFSTDSYDDRLNNTHIPMIL